MNSTNPPRVLITRQQYDEALTKLPDPRVYSEPFIEVDVDARSLMQALKWKEHPGTEDFPMIVTFDKVATDGKRFGLTPGRWSGSWPTFTRYFDSTRIESLRVA